MILNLTQHPATPDQLEAGVVDLPPLVLSALKEALTFTGPSTREEIRARAEFIAELACQNQLGGDEGDSPLVEKAMIGGAMWLMAPLCEELQGRGITPVFAFSQRVVVETPQPDGSVVKTAEFRHAGFNPSVGPGEGYE